MKSTFLFVFSFVFLFSCSNSKQDVLHIATAANMQFAMEEIVKEVNENYGITCEMIVGSSGKLTAQIKEGAPYDVFVSANMIYPEELYNSNKTITKPKVYAFGNLVAWTQDEEVNLEDLLSEKILKIAIANPKVAPYGFAANQFLKNKYNFDRIEKKLVYGESIAQVNQFVNTGVVDVGLTAKSVVLSSKLKNKGNWVDLNNDFYDPVKQGIVILNHADFNKEKAYRFCDFLFSKKGKEILKKYGYKTH